MIARTTRAWLLFFVATLAVSDSLAQASPKPYSEVLKKYSLNGMWPGMSKAERDAARRSLTSNGLTTVQGLKVRSSSFDFLQPVAIIAHSNNRAPTKDPHGGPLTLASDFTLIAGSKEGDDWDTWFVYRRESWAPGTGPDVDIFIKDVQSRFGIPAASWNRRLDFINSVNVGITPAGLKDSDFCFRGAGQPHFGGSIAWWVGEQYQANVNAGGVLDIRHHPAQQSPCLAVLTFTVHAEKKRVSYYEAVVTDHALLHTRYVNRVVAKEQADKRNREQTSPKPKF